MRYSTAISAMLMAGLVAAVPANLEERHDYWVTEYKTVEVTAYETAQVTVTGNTYTRTEYPGRHHGGKAKTYYAEPETSTCTEEGYPAPTPADEEHGNGNDYEQATYYTTYTWEYHEPAHTTPPVYTQPATPTYSSPAKATPTAAPPTGNSFNDKCLETHNNYRAMHGAAPLEWDNDMASWASGVSGACVFKHSGGPYGENLAAGYSSPEEAITAWYDEGSLYNYANGDFSDATGHFTQVVWKSAKKVGCAVYTCNGADGTPGDFLTCEYDTGNVIGEFQQNVLPATS